MKSAGVYWSAAVVLLTAASAAAANSDANSFARTVYEMTKAGNYRKYERLFDPRCHARAVTSKSFELRSDLLRRMNPGATVEAMSLAAYQAMRKKMGAPPGRVIYRVRPSHIVIVHGTIPDVPGGDRVELNPIVHSKNGWKLLEGDCLSTRPSAADRH